jgi:hypothetical protein
MKSPPNFGEACGTTSFESGSVSASVTFVPACGPLTALAVELSLSSPRTVAILVHGFRRNSTIVLSRLPSALGSPWGPVAFWKPA